MRKMFLGITTLLLLGLFATSNAAWAQVKSGGGGYDRALVASGPVLNVGAVATPVARTPDLIDSFYEATRPFWRFLGWVLSFTATDATAQVPPSKLPYDRALVARSCPTTAAVWAG